MSEGGVGNEGGSPGSAGASHPALASGILAGIVVLMAAGWLAYAAFRPTATPPPAEIAGDPLLVRGRALYLERCVSCHGAAGRGDGPLVAGLNGPAPLNLADEQWKYGDSPDQVLGIIARGSPTGAMPGWSSTYPEADLRALAGYVYHLAGRPVPEAYRSGVPAAAPGTGD